MLSLWEQIPNYYKRTKKLQHYKLRHQFGSLARITERWKVLHSPWLWPQVRHTPRVSTWLVVGSETTRTTVKPLLRLLLIIASPSIIISLRVLSQIRRQDTQYYGEHKVRTYKTHAKRKKVKNRRNTNVHWNNIKSGKTKCAKQGIHLPT